MMYGRGLDAEGLDVVDVAIRDAGVLMLSKAASGSDQNRDRVATVCFRVVQLHRRQGSLIVLVEDTFKPARETAF
jgi:hypothetical protein